LSQPVDIGGPYTYGVYTGDMSSNAFGSWQLTIKVVEGRLIEVQVETNADDRRSVKINKMAVPRLTDAVIKAQSAEINTISGATLTSRSYLSSLQSALDQAAI
jgi:uncharacterized protein with FMN-binding domain